MTARSDAEATRSPATADAGPGRLNTAWQERRRRRRVALWQFAILFFFLAAWEGLTRIPALAATTFIDPFFISRPSRIATRLWQWMQPGRNSVWPHLLLTLEATALGLGIGVGSGFAVGLALSQNRFLAQVLNPFIIALNSMPRIAFVPLITMLFGLGIASKVATSWFVVFFLVFFNTYKGGLSLNWWTFAAPWAGRPAASFGACASRPRPRGPSRRCRTPSASP